MGEGERDDDDGDTAFSTEKAVQSNGPKSTRNTSARIVSLVTVLVLETLVLLLLMPFAIIIVMTVV